MIFGIGIDITDVRRFRKWVLNPSMLSRFFNEHEQTEDGYVASRDPEERRLSAVCQHYAVRFAAKEAFSKALGTGITGFDLRDVYIEKTAEGKPELCVQNTAAEILSRRCGGARLFVSLSHEKEYAAAVVVIETGE